MGKKQKALQAQIAALQAQYGAAMQAAQTPDPYSQQIGNDAMEILKWSKGGDYHQAPKGVFFNFVDPAVTARQREISMNAGGQGTAALGTPNATLLGLNKQNMDDEFSRDAAGNYQAQVSNAVGNAANTAGQLGSQEMQKKLSILGQAGNMYGQGLGMQYQMANKPNFWNSLWKNGLTSFVNSAAQSAGSFGRGGG